MAKSGLNFNSPVDVKFYCYAANLDVAQDIEKLMKGVGFEADVVVDEETESISVYFEKEMLLTYDSVIAEQNLANKRLIAFDTVCDGWMVGVSPQGQN